MVDTQKAIKIDLSEDAELAKREYVFIRERKKFWSRKPYTWTSSPVTYDGIYHHCASYDDMEDLARLEVDDIEFITFGSRYAGNLDCVRVKRVK